ncbi:MAG: hypothetical protein AVDCRST_MAG35-1755, partial [uncultured Quadrisphaera sp.]
ARRRRRWRGVRAVQLRGARPHRRTGRPAAGASGAGPLAHLVGARAARPATGVPDRGRRRRGRRVPAAQPDHRLVGAVDPDERGGRGPRARSRHHRRRLARAGLRAGPSRARPRRLGARDRRQRRRRGVPALRPPAPGLAVPVARGAPARRPDLAAAPGALPARARLAPAGLAGDGPAGEVLPARQPQQLLGLGRAPPAHRAGRAAPARLHRQLLAGRLVRGPRPAAGPPPRRRGPARLVRPHAGRRRALPAVAAGRRPADHRARRRGHVAARAPGRLERHRAHPRAGRGRRPLGCRVRPQGHRAPGGGGRGPRRRPHRARPGVARI